MNCLGRICETFIIFLKFISFPAVAIYDFVSFSRNDGEWSFSLMTTTVVDDHHVHYCGNHIRYLSQQTQLSHEQPQPLQKALFHLESASVDHQRVYARNYTIPFSQRSSVGPLRSQYQHQFNHQYQQESRNLLSKMDENLSCKWNRT